MSHRSYAQIQHDTNTGKEGITRKEQTKKGKDKDQPVIGTLVR